MKGQVFIAKEMDSSMYCETMAQLVAPYIHEDEEFMEVMNEWDKITERHPNVAAVLDWGKEMSLSKEDANAIHRIFELYEQMHEIEKKALIIAVQNQMLGLFLQYENRKQ